MLGFEDGALDLDQLKPAKSGESYNRSLSKVDLTFTSNLATFNAFHLPTDEHETREIINKPRRFEHKQRVQVVDSCVRMQLFSTCR